MRQPALTSTASFQALETHAIEAEDWQLRGLFAADPQRFPKLTVDAAGLFLDYSKNRLDGRTLELLVDLAQERGVETQRDAMFAGERINLTERRAVLHTALRAPRGTALMVDGQDVNADVHAVLDRVRIFTDAVRAGTWLGHSGKPITDIVNIGIGGSDLGPKMVCLALRQYAHPRLTMHFVSNVDGHDMDAALGKVDPETTLFIIASKTFTTTETMMNAQTARAWFLQHAPEDALARHFVAVSTNTEAIKTFGIDPANMFPFWDWVGGRYSVWSAIGLSVALCVGFGHFSDLLAGAHAMDQHFQEAPLASNMPVLLALVGFWNRQFLGCASVSIAPYHQDLSRFPAYLQQLDMESNGKRVTKGGQPVDTPTCPVIWGDCGTNGQHAYFQLLHQGSDVTPIDFIAALRPAHELENHHAALLANCFAQSEAFMRGKTIDEVRIDLQSQGLSLAEIEALAPHKTFPGNRPSNTILMEYLKPYTLGALIALYEHKTFVQGVIWDVNSFDQWGVELGKVLAKKIEAELTGEPQPALHDSSTNGLIAMAKAAV
ncbi:glucose-6-phosphate isomerase [Massilia antarctica]|uniref:glucose-6-phosphate isomerase n=1 Tax=Massilia antarctica TaxID=2765360 RepID=UPI0006BB5C75|nr:glucose-6-phosphate isomerase [Massilia sp. H27-R4]MCY0913324.1 glucose-6-phosphate isomerase [Massilia sp. H27-R4]CUI07958.1 Glucose-6-phosphate isomerase [Janthinobacterium sp. CG23_2]CUU31744.1 Glucose-6-phosphate isomerase [Janthinobacterium sp. CG23_2]